ncbi:MAG: hypothetical protein A2152_01570 [Candidatus Levybacteria bacterium RBG_16_35_6]|nr:MAG: hypothetical protein A2152_01570 [Candidatus Levybacteria bacterium RBG_16_35_6]
MNNWTIKVYESPTKEKPVEEFIKSLNEKTQVKIGRVLDLLEEFGLEGASSHIKKLKGTLLWEIRIIGGDNIRILYVTIKGKIFLLLHGFKKKKQKTPRKEIFIAEKRLIDYESRENTA